MRASAASRSLTGTLLAVLSLLFVAAGDVLNQPIGTMRDQPFTFEAYKLVQYYVAYQDLGFVKRGLPGSIIALLSPDASHLTMYAVAASVVVCLVLLYVIFVVSSFANRGTWLSRHLLLVLFLTAPATFWQAGYDLGRYDHINMILLLVSLLMVERRRFVVAGCLGAVALLVHEASLFMFFPVVFAATLAKARPGLTGRERRAGQGEAGIGPLIAVGLPVALALVLTMVLGSYEPGGEAFQAAMARTGAPGNELRAMAAWTNGIGDNLRIVAERIREPGALIDLLAALVYFGVFCLFYLRFHSANGLPRDALCLSPLLAAPLFVIGIDFERWLAVMVMNMTIVLSYKMRGLKGTDLEGVVPARSNVLPALLLASAILGPLGVSTAFPLLDKLWNLVH